MRELPKHRRHLLNGSTVTECLVVIPAMLLLGLGVIQSLFFYQAKTVANYATFEAARKGAVTHAQPATMLDEFGLRMAAALGGDGSPEKLVEAIKKGRAEARDKDITRIDILSPTREAFSDFAVFNADSGKDELPNHHLRYQDRAPGIRGKVSIQDANLLTIQTTYGYKLTVPFVNKIVTAALARLDSANAAYYEAGRIPMKSQATVRMHSPVWLNDSMLALNQLPGASGNGGLGISGGGNNGSSTGGIGNGGGGNQSTSEPGEEEEEIECESRWSDSGYQGFNGFLLMLWDLFRGFLDGLGDQVSELGDLGKKIWQLISDSQARAELWESIKKADLNLQDVFKEVVKGISDDVDKVLQCGPRDVGRILGQNASPVQLAKIVTRIAKAVDSKALKRFAEDIKCASFPAGTEIWTANGLSRIEELTAGTLVHSRDEHSFVSQPQKIENTFSRVADGYHRLRTEYGWIALTAEHPLWVQGRGWVEAKDIDWEDPIATINGDLIVFENEYVAEPTKVYNFSVAESPNYFAGEFGVWVHNAKSRNCELEGGFTKLPETINWDAVVPNKGRYRGQSRDQHVRLHNRDNLSKDIHGVFLNDAVDEINIAWKKARELGLVPNEKGVLRVPMGRNVGYEGGKIGSGRKLDHIEIIVIPGTNKIITGYPAGKL
jgi:hypothetical protein